MDVGVIGASGYGGTELLRLCSQHPHFNPTVLAAAGNAGADLATFTPSLAAAYGSVTLVPTDPAAFVGLDVVFSALPHGASQDLAAALVGEVGCFVDLAADFRFDDPSVYDEWYGEAHRSPELLKTFAYGLPELDRTELPGATAIAVPGCYPTAATVALAPFVRAGLVEPTGIVVDAVSGLSGAGRAPKDNLHFAHAADDVQAYGLLRHRHTPEIERNLGGAQVLFTPHLVPMSRGMAATCYARPVGDLTTEAAMALLHAAYDDEPFVHVTSEAPSTKATLGSNCVHVTARVDERTGWLLVLSTLDNLVKGAAGGAIQSANLALGIPESTGLPTAGLYP